MASFFDRFWMIQEKHGDAYKLMAKKAFCEVVLAYPEDMEDPKTVAVCKEWLEKLSNYLRTSSLPRNKKRYVCTIGFLRCSKRQILPNRQHPRSKNARKMYLFHFTHVSRLKQLDLCLQN